MARGDLEVNITAIDRASDKIQDVARQAERLGDEEGEIVLRAEVKAAEKDLRRLRKELKEADGEEAEVRILADIAQAKGDIDALEGELDKLDKTVAEPEIEVPDAGGAGRNAGLEFGLSTIKGFGAAGVVAAFANIMNRGFDQIKIAARLRGQFGLARDEAERFGKEAADVYADNWGESVEQVAGALAGIDRALVETGKVSEEEAEGLTDDFLAVSDVLGMEVSESIRLVQLMIENGLAGSATEALDLIVTGFQEGANTADDLSDSVTEYAQHYGALGLSGADMMAQFIHGMENGQRDTDKLADAVKEFRIRAVEDTDAIGDAYSELGLDADDYRARIAAGGPDARAAFIEVLTAIRSVRDPVRKQALAVELIGTQYEDLGPKALDSLLAITEGTIDATGASEDLTEAVGDSATEWEILGRQIDGTLTDLGARLAERTNKSLAILQGADARREFALREGERMIAEHRAKMESEAKAAAEVADELAGKVIGTGGAMVDAAIKGALLGEEMKRTSGHMVQASIDAALLENANGDLTISVEDTAEAERDAAEAAEQRADEIGELIARIDELEGRQASLVGGTMAVENAEIAAREAAHEFGLALLGVDEQGEEVTLTQDEMTLAFNDATTAQMNAAQTAADYEVAQREANGETVSASDKNAILAQKYRDIASELDPGNPLRQRLEDYATELDEIPGEVVTAMTMTAPFDEVARYAELINGVPNLKETTLRTIRENVNREQRFQQNRFGESHTGSRFAAGETKIVVPGQVFTPDVGGRMSSVEESRRMTSAPAQSGSAGGTPVYISLMNGEQVKGMFDERDADLLRSLEGGLR